eukprot:scaffold6843_cov149-Isochrysis_galbana.AAC.8
MPRVSDVNNRRLDTNAPSRPSLQRGGGVPMAPGGVLLSGGVPMINLPEPMRAIGCCPSEQQQWVMRANAIFDDPGRLSELAPCAASVTVQGGTARAQDTGTGPAMRRPTRQLPRSAPLEHLDLATIRTEGLCDCFWQRCVQYADNRSISGGFGEKLHPRM